MPPDDHAGAVEAARPRDEIPVARPARARVEPEPEDPAPAAFPPGMVRGLATSLACHGLLLIVLAFWFIANRPPEADRAIETRLGGDLLGDPNGTDAGTTLVMGGIDASSIEPAASTFEIAPTPMVLPRLDRPDPRGLKRTAPVLSNRPDGGKVTNPGQGGGTGGEGFGPARFGSRDGTVVRERVQGIEVKVGDPQFTLIWDTKADLDLHVIEPGGSEISWIERTGDRGGQIDVDNLTGFGPENIFWGEAKDEDGNVLGKGHGPPGEYRWFVHYYGGINVVNQDVPTRWKVRIKHNGTVTVHQGTLRKRQHSKTYTLTVGARPGSADPPAEKPAETFSGGDKDDMAAEKEKGKVREE